MKGGEREGKEGQTKGIMEGKIQRRRKTNTGGEIAATREPRRDCKGKMDTAFSSVNHFHHAPSFALTNKQTPWSLVRKRTIPTERLSLVDEI
jgi:hypothetical protein